MIKRELIVLFLVTLVVFAFLVVKGFTPEVSPEASIPSPSPRVTQYFSPTPLPSASTLIFRSYIPEDAVTENRLKIGSVCTEYKGGLGEYSYVRDSDKSFLGWVKAFEVGYAQVEVNDYLYERVATKMIYHNSNNRTEYYDRRCNEILPGRIRVGDYAIVYAPVRRGDYYEAQYLQIVSLDL